MANFTAKLIHKQVYPATYTFKGDADGALPSGFTDASGAGASAVVAANWQSHKKVFKLTPQVAGNNADAYVDISEQTSGTIELWIGSDDVSFRTAIHLQEENTTAIQIELDEDEWQRDGATQIVGPTAADDTLYHVRIDYECGAGAYLGLAADTYFVTIDGTQYGAFAFDNAVDGINRIDCQVTDSAAYSGYYDAIGDADNDSDYNIGDNIFWRHLKDQDSAFEDEDWGTTSTNISLIDTDLSDANCTATIIPEFNEHKKILELFDNNAAGRVNVFHSISSPPTSGTIEFSIKVSDVTLNSAFYFRNQTPANALPFRIDASSIDFHDGAWQNLVAAVNDTRYHFRIDFECGAGGYKGLAADTCMIYIDNVQYGAFSLSVASTTIDDLRIFTDIADSGNYIYLDALSFSWTSGNEIGDNRTFEYHTESYDDITSSLSQAEVEDEAYLVSRAVIEASLDILTISALHILQLYDINSDLRFEGNFFKKTTSSGMDLFTFHSLNKSNLKKLSSYTASAEDPSEILLGIFTEIGQHASSDARLQYYEEDDPAGSHSPTIIRTPNVEIIRRMAYHADRYAIIKPNGVLTLDADRDPSNGAETINSSTGEIRGDPTIESFDSQINKVTVFGDFDLDIGIQFVGVSEDTTAQDDGTGINEYSKTYKDLRSDADCLARAVAIRTGTGFNPQIITAELLNVYANIGEVINFAYSPKSFSATDCYAKKATHNLASGITIYELSTGIFEDWGMSQEQWSLATEGERQNIDGIYNTDINTVYLRIIPAGGGPATETTSGVLMVNGDSASIYWYNSPEVDTSRPIDIYVVFRREDAGADTIDITKTLDGIATDGGVDTVSQWAAVADTLDASAINTMISMKYTLTAANNLDDYRYNFFITLAEAGKTIRVQTISIVYFVKRNVS